MWNCSCMPYPLYATNLFEPLNFFQLRTSYIFSPLCAVSTLCILVACTLLIDGLDYAFPYVKETSIFSSLRISLCNFVNLCYCVCYVQVAVAVLVSWLIFRNPISGMNAVGCAVTLVGCTFYGYVRHLLSQQPPGTPRTPRTPRNRIELLPLVNDKLDDKVWSWEEVECADPGRGQ